MPAAVLRVPTRASSGWLEVKAVRLTVDPVACEGHGLCAELFPEGIWLDDWGYPVLRGEVAIEDLAHARRALSACPALALRMRRPA
jgi:ferredoxin